MIKVAEMTRLTLMPTSMAMVRSWAVARMALPSSGELDEQGQQDHDNRSGQEDDKVGGADNPGNRVHEGKFRDQGREGQKVGGLGKQDIVLQKNRHADGRDERREPRCMAQRLVGQFFNCVAIGAGPDGRGQDGEHDDGQQGAGCRSTEQWRRSGP